MVVVLMVTVNVIFLMPMILQVLKTQDEAKVKEQCLRMVHSLFLQVLKICFPCLSTTTWTLPPPLYRNLGTTLAPEMVPSLIKIHDIGIAPNNWSWSPGGGIPHASHFHEQGWLQDQNQWHHNLPGCHKIVSCCQHRNENNWIKKMGKNDLLCQV